MPTIESGSIYETKPSPLRLERIVEEAQNFAFNPLIPLKYWLRTASTLLKEAKIYEREGNEQQLYLLLFRHATLVLRHLSIHPDARQPNYRLAINRANKDVQSNLAKLELLKPRLNKGYEIFEKQLKDADAGVVESTTTAHDDHLNHISPENQQRLPSTAPTTLNGSNHSPWGGVNELDAPRARNEIRTQASTLVNTSRSKVPNESKQESHVGDGMCDSKNIFMHNGQGYHQHNQELPHGNSSFRLGLDGSKQFNLETSDLGDEHGSSKFRYPEIQRQTASDSRVLDDEVPERPPKCLDGMTSRNTTYSGFKHNVFGDLADHVGVSTLSGSSSQHRNSTFTFKHSASLENGTLLRTIFLPSSLRISFLSLALPNTRANLETCGILCGTLISNALFISKLVIPDQESTSDTCDTINEDKLFDYVDGEDLMVLGWIHTHPTQTCFMSSRDLHTHAGYQVMMPESIAIVCAPSKEDWGIYRLTDPPGLSSVLKCTQTGLFHPHADDNIYTDALRPGHVHEAKGLEYDIVDLRMQC